MSESMQRLSVKTLLALYIQQHVVHVRVLLTWQAERETEAMLLILMGGGSFQAFAVREYLDYHKNSGKRYVHDSG